MSIFHVCLHAKDSLTGNLRIPLHALLMSESWSHNNNSLYFAYCRFMDSELDLNDEIQKLHVIATVPHLYQHIVDVNAVGTILGLLSHENSGDYILEFY